MKLLLYYSPTCHAWKAMTASMPARVSISQSVSQCIQVVTLWFQEAFSSTTTQNDKMYVNSHCFSESPNMLLLWHTICLTNSNSSTHNLMWPATWRVFWFPWQCAEDSVFLLHEVASYSRTMKPFISVILKINNTT